MNHQRQSNARSSSGKFFRGIFAVILVHSALAILFSFTEVVQSTGRVGQYMIIFLVFSIPVIWLFALGMALWKRKAEFVKAFGLASVWVIMLLIWGFTGLNRMI